MKSKLVPIGNSKGIRLPKAILDQCGLRDEIEIDVKQDHLIIRASHKARNDWDAAFTRMRSLGDDDLLDAETLARTTELDRTQWKW